MKLKKQEVMWLMGQLKEYVSTVLWRYGVTWLESVCLDGAVLYFNYF